MRILHITNTLSEGGVESFLLQLLPHLVQSGYEVDVLVLAKNKTALRTELEKHGIHVLTGPTGSPYNPLNIFRIRKYIVDYDIVHVHLWPAQLWVAIASLGKHTSIRYITTEHCNFNKRRQYPLYRPIEQWMYGRYGMIIGVCDAARNNLSGWIKHSLITAISNGIELPKFSNIPPYTNTQLSIPDEAIIVTMVARFFLQKDHLTLIRAIQYTPVNVHLILVGSGEMMTICQQEAHFLKLDDRIHFMGRRTDVPRIIASSDICVLSTNYEGLSISVLEYMAIGKPVIATNVDGIRELLPDPHWLVTPGKAEELGHKISELVSDVMLREQVATINKQQVANYDLNTMINKYVQAYQYIADTDSKIKP